MRDFSFGWFISSLLVGLLLVFIVSPTHTTRIDNKKWECTETVYPSKELNEKFAPYCIQYTKTEGK